MAKARTILFYQMDAYVGNRWKPIPDHTYACASGLFGRMLTRLKLTSAQRLRKVGVASNFSAAMREYDKWGPNFFYNGRQDSMVALR